MGLLAHQKYLHMQPHKGNMGNMGYTPHLLRWLPCGLFSPPQYQLHTIHPSNECGHVLPRGNIPTAIDDGQTFRRHPQEEYIGCECPHDRRTPAGLNDQQRNLQKCRHARTAHQAHSSPRTCTIECKVFILMNIFLLLVNPPRFSMATIALSNSTQSKTAQGCPTKAHPTLTKTVKHMPPLASWTPHTLRIPSNSQTSANFEIGVTKIAAHPVLVGTHFHPCPVSLLHTPSTHGCPT